jgi:uncharacterized membrane protein (UPF0127 family)
MPGRDTRYLVRNVTRDRVLADRSGKPTKLFGRGIGLMGRRSLPPGDGLIIQPCHSVVSFFMRFPIDVAFVDADGKVCHTIEPLVPWRTSAIVRQSRLVVELPAGTLAETGTQVGDQLEITPASG